AGWYGWVILGSGGTRGCPPRTTTTIVLSSRRWTCVQMLCRCRHRPVIVRRARSVCPCSRWPRGRRTNKFCGSPSCRSDIPAPCCHCTSRKKRTPRRRRQILDEKTSSGSAQENLGVCRMIIIIIIIIMYS
ncbi:hypothetical protein LSH36_1070g00000, partial [Paralvinella palmiformis]